eukprot:68015_1
MLSNMKASKKKSYKKNVHKPSISCSTQCILISITIFWFAFIFYIQYKFKQHPLEKEMTITKEHFEQHIHQHISKPSITHSDSILFWGNRAFDTKHHLKQLSYELDKDKELFDKCQAIMTSDHPKRSDIWSQAYQEWYLYHNFFYGKTDGIYLDIGAHKPLHLSNSAFFDKCLGWSGICVEPTDTSQLFKETRSCNVARRCVWSETKPLVMIYRSDGDASLIIDKKEQDRIKREVPDRVKDLFECEAIDATDLLNTFMVRNKYGQEMDISMNSNAHKIGIDFISLDVEGAEIEFLRCFPFDKYDVKVWSIEINKNEGLIDELMLRYGFMKYQYLSYFNSRLDAIYLKVQTKVKLPWNAEEREQWSKYQRCTQR